MAFSQCPQPEFGCAWVRLHQGALRPSSPGRMRPRPSNGLTASALRSGVVQVVVNDDRWRPDVRSSWSNPPLPMLTSNPCWIRGGSDAPSPALNPLAGDGGLQHWARIGSSWPRNFVPIPGEIAIPEPLRVRSTLSARPSAVSDQLSCSTERLRSSPHAHRLGMRRGGRPQPPPPARARRSRPSQAPSPISTDISFSPAVVPSLDMLPSSDRC